jgi:hypothetical protein
LVLTYIKAAGPSNCQEEPQYMMSEGPPTGTRL